MATATPSARSTASTPSPRDENAAEGRRTKDRLLDAAERLFAQRGFDGTSMRALTRAARTSVSAANYHFGSKENLLHAALQRRVEPVNRARLERLDQLEQRCLSEGRSPRLEEVLDAFLRPAFEIHAGSAESRQAMRQVAARLYADPPERVAALKRELFSEVLERFQTALAGALPRRDPSDLERAFQFTIGVMVHVLAGHLDTAPLRPDGVRDAAPSAADEVVLDSMIAFAAAGLRARRDASRAPAQGEPK